MMLLCFVPVARPRSPAPGAARSVSVFAGLHTARLRQKAKKGRSRDWRASISKGRLKNDVMSVAVRARSVRYWRERLLVKICRGDGKKGSTTLVSSIHRILKYKYC